MVKITALFVLSALSCLVSAAPVLEKRIAQVTSDSKAAWEQACVGTLFVKRCARQRLIYQSKVAAGGGAQCNKIGINAASTLLAAADACAQQDAADDMIDLAKQLDNDPEMIRLAQLFVQQPRNAVSIFGTLLSRYLKQPVLHFSPTASKFLTASRLRRTLNLTASSIVNSRVLSSLTSVVIRPATFPLV